MLTFNSRSVLSGFVKQLLFSFNLPSCKVFRTEEECHDFFTTKLTNSTRTDKTICIIRNYRGSVDAFVEVGDDGSPKKIKDYILGKFYPNITRTLKLENDIYDSYTHRYLGDFLRFVKDYFGINLMGMYNCFDSTTEISEGKKLLVVPVKYSKSYSVFIPSMGARSYYFTTDLEGFSPLTIRKKIKIESYSRPNVIESPKWITIGGNKSTDLSLTNESLLRLVIETEINDNSPIVVLEGDYSYYTPYFRKTQANFEKENGKYVNEEAYERLFGQDLKTGNSQLVNLLNTSNDSYPMADRLTEFLSGNAITGEDLISKNVIDAKEKELCRYEGKDQRNLRGTRASFTIMDRLKMAKALMENKFYRSDTQDITGYVDKDVEAVLDDRRYGEYEEEE